MDLISTIDEALNLLNLEYPTFHVDHEGKRQELWILMLRDFNPLIIQHAVYHLMSLGREFPPNVGQVRNQCAVMAHGELQDPTASEAWEHVMGRVNHEDLELTDFEKKALKQIGRTINDLRQIQSSNLSAERARYMEAFGKLIARRHLDRQTLPEVKILVQQNAPQLPASTEAQDKSDEPDEPDVMTIEEARKEHGPALDNLEKMWRGE